MLAQKLRRRRSFLAVALVLATAGVASQKARADTADASVQPDMRRAAVLVTVGTHAITVGELEDRLAQLAPFQLATFGLTRDAIRRKFLDSVLVRDALYVAGAESASLAAVSPTRDAVRRSLSNATLRATRATVGTALTIPVEDVRKFYDDNHTRYAQPERIGVWRILCATRDEALVVLEGAKKNATPATFVSLAREHSLDKATNLRGGNLGFLSLDGTSNEAGLKVDPSVVKAATTVRDGELVPAPVVEGNAFAVVWRRGTVPATKRSFDEASPQIRDTLFRQRVEEAHKALLSRLRAANLKEIHPELLETIEIAPENGSVVPTKRGAQPPSPPPSAPTPPRP